jgi:hypothetical protein
VKQSDVMRRGFLLLMIVAAGTIAAFFRGGSSSSLAWQEEAPPPTRLPAAPSLSSFTYQGVASCASVACHHGNGAKGSKGSEYTTWIAHNDPHSRAYTVLFDPQSLLIEKNLKGLKDLKEARPHTNNLCLSCHVHPEMEAAHHAERFSRVDGVGCESCHGPAEKWLSVHYQRDKSRDELLRLGMWDTKDVRKRAEVCVKCHVGWGDGDVNHDLIAAGHPRLRFEYGAYLANYPARHWRIEDDHARHADFEARAWLLGQVVSAKAAIDLLQHRAEPKHDKPWPEFAEYSCFGCHHDLQDQKWRRKPGAAVQSWGTWYFSLLPDVNGEISSARPGDRNPFDRLTATIGGNSPDTRRVLAEAKNASAVLERWADALQHQTWDEKALTKLLAVLVKDDRLRDEPEWDRAAQRYLGIAAVYNALDVMDSKYRKDADLKAAILCLPDTLAFPKSPGEKFDSPRNFDPERLRSELKRVQKELQSRGVK